MGSTIQPVSAEVMMAMTEKDIPQGVLAMVKQRRTELDDLDGIKTGVALISPQDPQHSLFSGLIQHFQGLAEKSELHRF